MQVYSSKKGQGVAQEQDLQDPQQAVEANSVNVEALAALPPDAPEDPGIIAQLIADEDAGTRGIKLGKKKGKAAPDNAVVELESESEGSGSATVATSAGAGVGADDDASYTKVFLKLKKDNPDLTDDELLKIMAKKEVNKGSRTGTMGENAATEDGDKVAVVIGNEDYAGEDNDLKGAAADANAMASKYDGDGFDVDAKDDLTGSEISREVGSAGSGLEEGDELMIYYAGHGLNEGLLGVDYPGDGSVVPHSTMAAAANAAVSGGYHATVIVDACESGALVDEMEAAGKKDETEPATTE